MADPNSGTCCNRRAPPRLRHRTWHDNAGCNNAGELTGVPRSTIRCPTRHPATWRNMDGHRRRRQRAADFNVYWGAGGVVDSVIDVTHNVPVPFTLPGHARTRDNGGWGILNPPQAPSAASDDRRAVLTAGDIGLRRAVHGPDAASQGILACPCSTAAVRAEQHGPLGADRRSSTTSRSATRRGAPSWPDLQPSSGFIMYLAGTIYHFGLPSRRCRRGHGLVAPRLRRRHHGGNGTGGDQGPYSFAPRSPGRSRPSALELAVRATTSSTSVNAASEPGPHQGPHGARPVLRDQRVRGRLHAEDHQVREPPDRGDDPHLLVERRAGPGAELRARSEYGGDVDWNVRNRNNQVVASGVYFYHVESGDARHIGRMTIVNFAQ